MNKNSDLDMCIKIFHKEDRDHLSKFQKFVQSKSECFSGLNDLNISIVSENKSRYSEKVLVYSY